MAMAALYALTLELVACFGFLCILLNVLLPVLAFILRFVLVDVPREWHKWQLHRAQQRELRQLQRRVDVLTRRKQADEHETRRRARTASAHKRQQREKPPQGTVEEGVDFISGQDACSPESGSKARPMSTPRPQRHRLSINSTAKKPASSTRRRTRD